MNITKDNILHNVLFRIFSRKFLLLVFLSFLQIIFHFPFELYSYRGYHPLSYIKLDNPENNSSPLNFTVPHVSSLHNRYLYMFEFHYVNREIDAGHYAFRTFPTH